MTTKRLLLAGLVLIVVIGGVVAVRFFTLTAPVDVSDASPVAATLAAPTAAPTALTVQPAVTVQPDATAAPAPTTDTTAGDTAAQLYRIDANQSEASYQVQETFFRENNRVATAVGRTNAVAGDLLIDRADPTRSQVGEIVVDISQLTSDSSRRDNAIRREWLESATYPLATFRNGQISNLPADVQEGQPFSFTLSGDLTVHDTTNPVTWDVTLTLNGDQLSGTATTQFRMSSFNVQPPDIGGVLRAEDDVILTLNIVALAVEE